MGARGRQGGGTRGGMGGDRERKEGGKGEVREVTGVCKCLREGERKIGEREIERERSTETEKGDRKRKRKRKKSVRQRDRGTLFCKKIAFRENDLKRGRERVCVRVCISFLSPHAHINTRLIKTKTNQATWTVEFGLRKTINFKE